MTKKIESFNKFHIDIFNVLFELHFI